ncbi:MAG: DUF4386 domain-containing protein [Cyclobacteriaceae bacterium]|nr:DUF4386 domain-containing protein [Cyclobacteriaceae bacterium]UYN87910.1 MAG: DUF4386 domain-containing protein [Cyclobacteriaceae bacterium]
MKRIFRSTKIVITFAVLILSSCATPSNVGCPSFGSGKVTKSKKYKSGISTFKIRKAFALNTGSKSKREKISRPNFVDNHFEGLGVVELDLLASNKEIDSHDFFLSNLIEQNHRHENKVENLRKLNLDKKIKIINTTSYLSLNEVFEKKETLNTIQDALNHKKSRRKGAILKGGAIILMALLAGISIPVLGTSTASIGLVAILFLDVLISIGIIRYYRNEKPKLAKATGYLRLIYSAIFGVGIGYHMLGNVAMFNKFWSLGLIAFGIHLVALGILFNNEGGKKWVNYTIKSLLIIAGIGYMLLNVGLLFTANPVAFTALIQPVFIVPQILGEILFALWMILKGGRIKEQ